jgi:hypothetical protein
MNPDTAPWLALAICPLLILLSTSLWAPLREWTRVVPGGGGDPPWAIWARVVGFIVGVVGLGMVALYWCVR